MPMASSTYDGKRTSIESVSYRLERLPLVAYLFNNDIIAFEERPIDATWQYTRVIPKKLTGFDPLSGFVFVPSRSFITGFLSGQAHYTSQVQFAASPAWLAYEVLYAIHDFLHSWTMSQAYLRYQRDLSDLTAPYSRNLLLGLLSISEVAATVGLDYWYLSHFTNPHHPEIKCLSTHYRAGDCLTIDNLVQHKCFFYLLLSQYLPYLDLPMTRSSINATWFPKEQRQADLFVKLMKAWTDYCYGTLPSPHTPPDQMIRSRISEFATLICDKLWDATHNHDFGCFNEQGVTEKERSWHDAIPPTQTDYRFFNIHSNPDWLSLDFLSSSGTISNRQYGYAVAQYIVSFDKVSCREFSADDFKSIVVSRNIGKLKEWKHNQVPIGRDISSRKTLIFPN